MDDLSSLDTLSHFSSIAEIPVPLEKHYAPLAEVFNDHSAELPDQHLPEPNSEAIVKSLKALQVKICDLESERAIAAERFKCLQEEAGREALDTDVHGTPHVPWSRSDACTTTSANKHELQKRLNERVCQQSHELSDVKQQLHKADTWYQHGVGCCKKLEQQHLQLLQHQKKILNHLSKKSPELKKSSKKKRVKPCKYGALQCQCKPVPGVHYRVNLKDVPFILTASTSPSHSVTANYQQVLASMKSHSPLLCGAAATTKKVQKVSKSKQKADLKSLLTTLEEEFGQLSFEHQELAQQLEEEPTTSKDYQQQEKKLQVLVDQMESKSKQIDIVSKELQCIAVHPRKRVIQDSCTCQELLSPREASVKFLRNMKAIQTKLQQDDLSWD